jgi:DHA1 family tetracycline resistance protein-like MFS transporter
MQKKATVGFILGTMFIESVGFGILIPVLPDIFKRFGQGNEFVASWYGYFVAIYALMQFLASPLLGALSDGFGRRPVLLVSLLFGGLDYLMMAFAPNLGVLFLGRILAGLTGAVHTVASAYMADVSLAEDRSKNFGLIGAAFGVGFIAGPILGGMAAHYGGSETPFLVAALMSLLNFLFGWFVLPESLSKEHRRPITWSAINPFKMLARLFLGNFPLKWIALFALMFLVGQVHPSTWTLFTQFQFGWNASDVGVSLALVGVSMAVVQGGLINTVVKWLGENGTIFWGTLISTLTFCGFAFLKEGWMVYLFIPLFGVSGVVGPVLQSKISANIPSNEQGELQGSMMALNSLISVFAPVCYTNVFVFFSSKSSHPFGGASYLMAGVISGFLTVGAYYLIRSSAGKVNTQGV